MNEFLMD